MLIAERGNLAQLEFDPVAAESFDHRREIGASECDMVNAVAGGGSTFALHKVDEGFRAGIQPVPARLERRAPALAKPDDLAVELPELRDIHG